MSRSRPRASGPETPVKYNVKWSGKDGVLTIYDRQSKKEQQVKTVDFVVLDELHTVAGFKPGRRNEKGKPIRGTEVRDVKNDEISVFIDGKKVDTGVWAELKEGINGIKYAKSVYIGLINKKGVMEIAKFTLSGSGFSGYLNFLNAQEEYEGMEKVKQTAPGVGITLVGKSKLKTNGDSKYYEPMFDVFELSDDEEDTATELDQELQKYLDAVFDNKVQATVEEEEEEEEDEPRRTSTRTAPKRNSQKEEEEEDDEPRSALNSRRSSGSEAATSSRRSRRDEEEEEDERPSRASSTRSRKNDDDDEPRSSGRSSSARSRKTDDDDEPTPSGRGSRKTKDPDDIDPDDLPF